MRIGIVHPMVFPEIAGGEGPIAETLENLLEDDFFDVVEVTSIRDARLRSRVRSLFECAGKEACGCAQPLQLRNRLNLNSSDETERRRAVDMCKDSISEAAELDAEIWSFLSGVDPGPSARGEAMLLLTDSVSELCAHAKSCGQTQPALETFDRDVDKKALIGPNVEAAAFAREMRRDCPRFGLVLDMGHIPLQGETFNAALEATKNELCLAHMGNCLLCDSAHPLYGDKHPRFGIEGGEHDVAQLANFLLELLRIGYIGERRKSIVSFEMRPCPGESSKELIENAKTTLLGAWQLLTEQVSLCGNEQRIASQTSSSR